MMRAVRTFLGVPLISLATIIYAIAIGIADEGPAAERMLRCWSALVL